MEIKSLQGDVGLAAGTEDKKRSIKDMFDTSVCQVKFRKPRIDVNRDTSFDQDRELSFDHRRVIDVRLQGVIFRDHFSIDFGNNGVSNIQEIASDDEWPEIDPPSSPASLIVERDEDWDRTWGKDISYNEKWGKEIDEDYDTVLYPAKRLDSQLTYHNKKGSVKKGKNKREKKHKMASRKKKTRKGSSTVSERPGIDPKERGLDGGLNVIQSGKEPIRAPPSRKEKDIRSGSKKSSTGSKDRISPKDKKRSYAFNEYALSLMESGQYERAMKYFKKALDLDPHEEAYETNMRRCKQWIEYGSRRR